LKNKTFQLTPEQANKAIELCLKNAKSFLEDVKIGIEKSKKDHLSIPLVYSLEEIGKAKIIKDAMANSPIIISINEIKDHELKLKKAVNFLDVPFGKRFMIDMLFDMEEYMGTSPMAYSATENERNELRNTANDTHNLRMTTAFVNFDQNTNEPILETDNSKLIPLIESISELIEGFNENKKYPEDFTIDDVKKFPI